MSEFERLTLRLLWFCARCLWRLADNLKGNHSDLEYEVGKLSDEYHRAASQWDD